MSRSTFYVLDHSFGQAGPPILFETMIFRAGVAIELYQRRYATYDEAEAGHREVVRRLQAGEALDG